MAPELKTCLEPVSVISNEHLKRSEPLESSPRERSFTVFLLQQPCVIIWYFHRLILENTVPQGKDVRFLAVHIRQQSALLSLQSSGAHLIVVLVFTSQLISAALLAPHSRHVNKQPLVHIYIPSVYHIQPVCRRTIHISRVDLQHVASPFEPVYSHVVVAGQEVNRIRRHLNIDIRIPGQDLRRLSRTRASRTSQTHFAIPPPTHQRPVHDPGLRTEIVHGREVRFHEHAQVRFLIIVAQWFAGKSVSGIQHQSLSWDEVGFAPAIIMWMKTSMRT